MTTTMQYALRMMYEASDEPAAVTIVQQTRPIRGGAPFINVRTARALAALGLAAFDRGGMDPSFEWFSLTDEGRCAASRLPSTAIAACWSEKDGRYGRWVYNPNAR